MIVGCVDSRVSPEVIFDALPGELLLLRNVANLIPAYEPEFNCQHGTSAALEFGVQVLRVKHIVVLGPRSAAASEHSLMSWSRNPPATSLDAGCRRSHQLL